MFPVDNILLLNHETFFYCIFLFLFLIIRYLAAHCQLGIHNIQVIKLRKWYYCYTCNLLCTVYKFLCKKCVLRFEKSQFYVRGWTYLSQTSFILNFYNNFFHIFSKFQSIFWETKFFFLLLFVDIYLLNRDTKIELQKDKYDVHITRK